MTEKNYRIIQAVFIAALVLLAVVFVFWLLNKDRQWSSLLMYVALALVTATNYGIARRNYQSQQKK